MSHKGLKTLSAVFVLMWVIGISLSTMADKTSVPSSPEAMIYDLHSGKSLSLANLAEKMKYQDVVLLGEQHDNPFHHEARAQLIESLDCPTCNIIAEHLSAGKQVKFSDSLLGSLELNDFDAKGWGWPLHEPLFKAIQIKKLPLMGGNISNSLSSSLFKQGEEAIPSSLLKDYQLSTLSDVAQQTLDQDLKDGHCGQLPEQYLAPMRLVQRMKDATFAQLLNDHVPSILIAGNGHVRKDYGVAQILAAAHSNLKVMSVGFIEPEDWIPESKNTLANLYDVVWVTHSITRSDPCKDFAGIHPKN